MGAGVQIHQGVLFGNGMECIRCFPTLCPLEDIITIAGHLVEGIVITMMSVVLVLHPPNKINHKSPLIKMQNFKRESLDALIRALIQSNVVEQLASARVAAH